jgi:hypothetical protein
VDNCLGATLSAKLGDEELSTLVSVNELGKTKVRCTI